MRKAFAILFTCLCLNIVLLAQEVPINWPVENAPSGSNPAAFPTCRNDWMQRFMSSVNRSKQGGVDLLFEGDSITQGWGGAGRDVWQKRYGKLNAAFYGISGDRTENVLWRLQHGQVDGISPKLVVIMIGTNNTGRDSAQQIAEGVTAVVNEYKTRCPHSHILLLAVFPRSEKAQDGVRVKIKELNEIISKLDDGKTVTYRDIGAKFLQPDGTLTRDIMPDLLHPNGKGYDIWADAIQDVIDKHFPKS